MENIRRELESELLSPGSTEKSIELPRSPDPVTPEQASIPPEQQVRYVDSLEPQNDFLLDDLYSSVDTTFSDDQWKKVENDNQEKTESISDLEARLEKLKESLFKSKDVSQMQDLMEVISSTEDKLNREKINSTLVNEKRKNIDRKKDGN